MIPDYQTLMKPVLEASIDGEVSISGVIEMLGTKLGLVKRNAIN